MAYKTILVCLTTKENAARLTRSACAVARKFDAHLIGIHTLQATLVYPGVGLYLPESFAQPFYDHQKAETKAIARVFEEHTRSEDFVSEWREVNGALGDPGQVLAQHARCGDLVIMSQPDPKHDRADHNRIQREIIEQSGRPVLMIPFASDFDTFGENVVFGWSATRECTRAVHDALPFMSSKSTARLLWVSKNDEQTAYYSTTASELAKTIDRHGVHAVVDHHINPEESITDVLLNEAFDSGADMVVVGAYGHSGLYDFVIGATTTQLLRQMTVPVLFSK